MKIKLSEIKREKEHIEICGIKFPKDISLEEAIKKIGESNE